MHQPNLTPPLSQSQIKCLRAFKFSIKGNGSYRGKWIHIFILKSPQIEYLTF